MRCLEYAFIFHAQAGEIVGIEEAPVVNVVRGNAPVGETKGLGLNKLVEFLKTGGSGGIAIDQRDGFADATGDFGRARSQLRQAALMNLFVAAALGNAIAGNFLPGRQMTKGCNQALKFEQIGILFAEGLSRLHSAVLKYARIFLRVDGETMFVIRNVKFTALLVKHQLQFTTLQHGSVMIAEYGDQHLSMELFFERLPVDVKEIGVRGRLSILQHIEPPGVIAAHNAHVIGNDVENQSHAAVMQGGHKMVEFFSRANLRIKRVVIDDIVSVHAAGTSLQAWRDVAVADAEI